MLVSLQTVLLALLLVLPALAQAPKPAEAAQSAPPAAPQTAPAPVTIEQRTQLNLLGQTDTRSGESRRNENIQFNLIDNNLLKDLIRRLGSTATIVQEFRPDRSYMGAEFGNSPAGGVHVAASAVKGTHGRVYWTHLNSVFSARSFFQVGDVRSAHENEYGGELLTPIWRSATLSLSGSQQKIRGMVNGNVLVPLATERTPLAAEPALRAYVARILGAYPAELPNRPDIDLHMLNTNSTQRIDSRPLSAQLDQRLGAPDRLSFRYSLLTQRVVAFQLVAGQNPDTWTRSHQARITWSRQWSSATSTNATVGFDRINSLLVPEKNNIGPSFAISGLTTVGAGPDIYIDRSENLFRYGLQVQQARGKHTWSAGFELTRRQLNGWQSDSHRGSFYFSKDFGRDAITNVRMGEATRLFRSVGNVNRGFRNWDMAYFVSDKWRANQDLTLSFALRYAPLTRPTEVNGLSVIPYRGDWNNFGPQFGFAYRLPPRYGVLRGAYGLQYGSILPATFQQIRFNPPGNIKLVIPKPDLLDPVGEYLSRGATDKIRNSLYILDPGLRTPYSHQYNFSWEPELTGVWRLQLGYVGSRTNKLLQMLYINRAVPVPGIPFLTSTVDDRRPDPDHSEVKDIVNSSRGYYDAARVTVIVPNWKGLSLDASYWFSKALDLGTNYSDTAASRTHPRSQWEFESHKDLKARSDFDQPSAFLVRLAYEVPPRQSGRLRSLAGAWSLSTVVSLKSGTPFTVESGSDSPGFGNADGAIQDRVNLLDPSVLGRTIGNPNDSRTLLPRSAFAFMPTGAMMGNIGRNVFRKGPIHNLNAGLGRRFTVGPDRSLLFRAESVNLFNTAQFAEPGTYLTEANFGVITNTLNDGRTFRFTLRFEF